MPCPDETCSRKTKRKHFVPEQCIHSSRVECDCGASIRLGRGEWIKHKDSECPNTNPTSPRSLEATAYADSEQQRPPKCPGAEFGCTDEIAPEDIETHTSSCPLARLAPALKKQSQLLQSLSDQLKMANLRNDVLETGFDRLSDLISTTIEPRLNRLSTAIETDPDTTTDTDIEEIPRNDLDFNLNLDVHQDFSSQNQTQTYHPTPSSHALTTRLTALESQTSTLQSHLTDLDARSSMSLMNETLRIREELAQINGAMYSTRAQVQWLLNRERMLGQRETTSMMGRGRQGQGQRQTGGSGSSGGNGSGGSATTPTPTSTAGASSGSSAAPGTQRPSMDRNMSSAWSTVSQAAAAGSTSGPSSAATSPMFSAARPSLRRLSGGSSQERVKL
ncbi:hypothetical protein PMZ80_008453 [Knufia obscura]|uniref:TRAF-type domain-containing protein n=2 Tax=Knufia TaxID=430999 RepID=A0AAN8EH16_9EURO|nr:hypothetical protein PMZ80_008453 [Knufia obscura]KAK5951338.1 hypothetical protein OHC33_007756 [Knufia fluminis]